MDQRILEEPAGEPTVRRVWQWDGELSDAEREELGSLRDEAERLRARVTTLTADVKQAQRTERDLRGALKWLAGASPFNRRRIKRRLREQRLI
jgi:uncharacterized protein YlxW (UPF0749 family)